MYAAFRSHCLFDYPEYELLFGASDPNEPALALVAQLQQEFPHRKILHVPCPKILGLNGKVSTLAQMVPEAKYEYILINDSDIVAPPDYLRRVMSCFGGENVGMVTSLYRGLPGDSLPSRVEALGLSTDFMGGVLVAREMEGGVRFALGATMATTRKVLGEIGGLEALVDYLGDDYELGARTAAAGYRVELADVVVETALPDYTWGGFWSHQLRWARNVRDRRAAQYFGLIVTFGLAWGILAVLFESAGMVDVGGAGGGCVISCRRSDGGWTRSARGSARLAGSVAAAAARFRSVRGLGRQLRQQRSRVARDEVQGEGREAGEGVRRWFAERPQSATPGRTLSAAKGVSKALRCTATALRSG